MARTYRVELNAHDEVDREVATYGTVTYAYDAAGRRLTMGLPGQPITSFTYDGADRLTPITRGTTVVDLGYDAAGRRERVDLPNGMRMCQRPGASKGVGDFPKSPPPGYTGPWPP